MTGRLLAINCGSSSIKFALFESDDRPQRLISGILDRIGQPGARLRLSVGNNPAIDQASSAPTSREAIHEIFSSLSRLIDMKSIVAVGHRVVHGGSRFLETTLIDNSVMADLRSVAPLAPNHLPGEIDAIEASRQIFTCPQFACFDTAFHRTLPRVARMLPIPRRYEAHGLRRYGFHGLSFSYLLEELARLSAPAAVPARVVLAHLGGGCSLAAIENGVCIDTTMAFTPCAGLVMATRTGDLDPGVLIQLARTEHLSPDQLDLLVNRQSGLLGVSESSGDLRDLLARESQDVRAAEAIELFCYSLRKGIGAFAAVLGGLDAIVFSAGIGEHSDVVRERVCRRFEYLGVELDQPKNSVNADVISTAQSSVIVRVISTDEEVMMVREVRRLLNTRTNLSSPQTD